MSSPPSKRPFPESFRCDEKNLIEILLSQIPLSDLDTPFELPAFSPSFESLQKFADIELKVQMELLREDLSQKVSRCMFAPKTTTDHPEKHLKFRLPEGAGSGESIHLPLHKVDCQPPRARFTDYILVMQRRSSDDPGVMQDLTLAFCEHMRKSDGAGFLLGKVTENISELRAGTKVYCRPLKSYSMMKTDFRALVELRDSAPHLEESFAIKQLLRGLDPEEVFRLEDLDSWRNSNEGNGPIQLAEFNAQQQRALALEDLTREGVVLVQGPPGTGKSHIICHGILPQVVSRNEKVLVVCNSNIAVDALLLKCTRIPCLDGKLLRCGFKANVSDEVVDMGLYAEGSTLSPLMDNYGNFPGSNSNACDASVQNQIRSKQVLFTTIHYASKEKPRSEGAAYWDFDTLVLDEAAQLEDSKIFMVLSRSPALKKIVLIGDPKQLQPYVSDSLRQQGHGKSTMERLMELAPVANEAAPYIMLEEQFRMAPSLRALVSDMFYHGRLEDNDCVKTQGPASCLALKPLLVVNVTGTEMSYSRMHQSYENKSEAAVVKAIYDFLFSTDFDDALPETLHKRDVCVLTPYNRHKDRLRMLICGIDEEDADVYSGHVYARSTPSPSKKSQLLFGTQDEVNEDAELQLANIDTVDKFQGSERKAVIVSTCVDRKPLRASDPHFIDVACSRARHLLIAVGNFSFGLAGDSNWDFVKNSAERTGCYLEHRVLRNKDGSHDLDLRTLHLKLSSLLERPNKKLKL